MKNFINKKVSLFIALFVVVQGISLSGAERKLVRKETIEELLNISTSKSPAGRLFDAIEGRNLRAVKQCLDNGIDVNARNILNYTPLMVAATVGNEPVMTELIKRGANLEDFMVAADGRECTAFNVAVQMQKPRSAFFLLERGAKATDLERDTMLISATNAGQGMAVAKLLKLGANPLAQNQKSLKIAQQQGNPAIVKLLETEIAKREAALKAKITRQEEKAATLAASFDREVAASKPAVQSSTSAAKNKKKKVKAKAKAQAQKGASASAAQSKIGTPVLTAEELEVIKAKKKKADEAYDAQLEAARKALVQEKAKKASYIESDIQRILLLKEQARITNMRLEAFREQEREQEARSKLTDEDLLMQAAITGDVALAERMLAKKVNPNCTNLRGLTALAVAIQFEHFDVASMLKKHGATSVAVIVDAHLHPTLLQLEHKS